LAAAFGSRLIIKRKIERRYKVITYTVFYPYKKDSHFDMDYYCNRHIATAKSYFGDACKGIVVLKGNIDKGKEPLYSCICHLFFDNRKDFYRVIEKANAELVADVKNYTDIEPTAEIVEVLMQE
jgi:uncharacterized protein (TIGR02118 family)